MALIPRGLDWKSADVERQALRSGLNLAPGLTVAAGIVLAACLVWLGWTAAGDLKGSAYLVVNGLSAVPVWAWLVLMLLACGVCYSTRLEAYLGLVLSVGIIGLIGIASASFEDNQANKCLGITKESAIYAESRVLLNHVKDCNASIIVDFRVSKPNSPNEFKALLIRHHRSIGGLESARLMPGFMDCQSLLSRQTAPSAQPLEWLVLNGQPVAKAACAWRAENAFSLKYPR